MTTQICVAVIIEKDGKILLFKEEKDKPYEKSKGLWTLPIGKVQKREDLKAAAIRETREEVGYEISLKGIIGVYEMSHRNSNEQVMGFAFKSILKNNNKDELREFKNAIWVNSKNLIKSNRRYRKGVRDIIKDYYKNITLPINHVKKLVIS